MNRPGNTETSRTSLKIAQSTKQLRLRNTGTPENLTAIVQQAALDLAQTTEEAQRMAISTAAKGQILKTLANGFPENKSQYVLQQAGGEVIELIRDINTLQEAINNPKMGIKQKIDEYIKRAIYSFMLNEIYSTKFPEINTTIDDKESAQILLAKWNSRTDKPSTEDFLAQLQKEYPAIGTIRSKLKEDLEERIINGLIIRIERNTVKN